MEEHINFCEAHTNQQREEMARIRKLIDQVKEEYEFFDPAAELDNMFPNRHDDDFDEDEAMSISSFFDD